MLATHTPITRRSLPGAGLPPAAEPRPAVGVSPEPERCRRDDVWAAVAGLAVVGATAVGLRWAGRPPAVRTITMGPGGWVSFKDAGRRRVRPRTERRPWWAVLLRAERL